LNAIVDDSSAYLHIIITSEVDKCSKANLENVMNLSRMMKRVSTHFKCATISFNAKGNQELKG